MTNMTDDEAQWTSSMPNSAIEAVGHAAEAVGTANHATMHTGDFDHGDLYRLLGELSQLTQRLPQLFEQTRRILNALDAAGNIDVDHDNLPGALAVWDDAMHAVTADADRMRNNIDRAFNELSAVKASDKRIAELD